MSSLWWSCALVGVLIGVSSGVQQPVNDYNGQIREMSVYEQYCCQYSNRGKSFKLNHALKLRTIIFCPNECPQSCFALFNSSTCAPPTDCTEVLSSNPQATSGFYEIGPSGNETVSVYCDMEGVNCDGEGGWTRVAYLNMTQQGATCPSGLYQQNYNSLDHPVCGRNTSQSSGGCATHVYSTLGAGYSKMCGRVRGYQKGIVNPNDFHHHAVSLWLDSSSTHVWTFIANSFDFQCSCSSSYELDFNYFCESGHDRRGFGNSDFFFDDPLWDGQNCTDSEASTGCCSVGNIPWFMRSFNLSRPITEDLRFNVCLDREYTYGDIPVDMIEIFVK